MDKVKSWIQNLYRCCKIQHLQTNGLGSSRGLWSYLVSNLFEEKMAFNHVSNVMVGDGETGFEESMSCSSILCSKLWNFTFFTIMKITTLPQKKASFASPSCASTVRPRTWSTRPLPLSGAIEKLQDVLAWFKQTPWRFSRFTPTKNPQNASDKRKTVNEVRWWFKVHILLLYMYPKKRKK